MTATHDVRFDPDEAARAYRLLTAPDETHELRILKTKKRTVSGYFNDPEKLIESARKWSGQAPGIYVTLNPVLPSLQARADNRTIEYADTTTSDKDIIRRRWLPIDLDPVRPSGISATEDERETAKQRARDIVHFLEELGWPRPVAIDSGNGFHLLCSIDLPNDAGATSLVAGCIDALSFLFDDDKVLVDRTTYNAARIWKLPGTLSAKGDSTHERPHRIARVIYQPESTAAVTASQLQELASMKPAQPAPSSTTSLNQPFDLQSWITCNNLDIVRIGPWQGGTRWVLRDCPWNDEHTNLSAYIVQLASGAISAGCHHNGCAGNGWHELRDKVEPGWRDRRQGSIQVSGKLPSRKVTVPRITLMPDDHEWPAHPVEIASPAPRTPRLPAEMIPEPFREWVVDATSHASIPAEMVAVPALAAASAVIGSKLSIRPEHWSNWAVVPNLWSLLIARSGALKSYALEQGTIHLKRLEQDALADFRERDVTARVRISRLEAEIAGLKERAKSAVKSDESPADQRDKAILLEHEIADRINEIEEVRAVQRRYLTNDATVEKTGELLQANTNGLAVVRDEIFGLIRSLEKQGREGDREFYLEAANGTGSFQVDRIGRGSLFIPSLTLSLIGGTQPSKLAETVRGAITGGSGDDGFLQRFQLSVWIDRLDKFERPTHYPNAVAKNRAFEVFKRLDTLTAGDLNLTTTFENEIPSLTFAPDAQALFDAWRAALERLLRSNELEPFPAYESHRAKYRSLMPSLALIFHLVDVVTADQSEGDKSLVSLNATRLAAEWCDYLDAHARLIYWPELNAIKDAALLLLEKIESGAIKDGQTIREVYRAGWSGLSTAERVRSALQVLSEHGWTHIQETTTEGRPSEIIRLHPDLRGAGDDN